MEGNTRSINQDIGTQFIVDDLQIICAIYNSCHVITGKRVIEVKNTTLDTFLRRVNSKLLVRVHQSIAVNLKAITYIDLTRKIVSVAKHEVPLGDEFANSLLKGFYNHSKSLFFEA